MYFADNPRELLEAYVESEEGLSVAGGFAIQVSLVVVEFFALLTSLGPRWCLGSQGGRGLQQRGWVPCCLVFPAPGFASGGRSRLSGNLGHSHPSMPCVRS